MKIIIGNKVKLVEPPDKIVSWLINRLTFPNPKFEEAKKHNRYTGNIPQFLKLYKMMPNGIIIPRGMLETIEETFLGKGYNVSVVDNRVINKPLRNIESDILLRPYQNTAKLDLLKHPNGMLIAPAASGKTIIGLDIFTALRQKMLWLTHTTRLANQVRERILGNEEDPPMIPTISGDEIGLIGRGKWKIGDKITIGIIQTLVRRLPFFPELGKEFGLVIVDEAHHVPASTFLKVLEYFYSYYLYGLTATPYRRDKLENIMFASMGRPNAIITREEVKKRGNIITPIVKVREISSIIWEDNDYHYIIREIILPNEVRSNLITLDVASEASKGNYCIVISTRKEYCEILLKKISKYWSKTGIATGDYTRNQNDDQVRRLESDEITVLITTFELLGEGFDVQKLNRGFIALPFRERARVEQAVGRIQRTCEGKIDAILYDYVDKDIGILKDQFRARSFTYKSLGMKIIG